MIINHSPDKNTSILHSYILPLAVILFIQGVDYLYFNNLHKGLKFPDYFPIMISAIYISWRFVLRRDLTELIGVNLKDRNMMGGYFMRGFKYGLFVVLAALIGSLLTSEARYSLNFGYLKSMSYMLIGYIIFIPISALYEELHYRGVFLKGLRQEYLTYITPIFSSAIFAYVHISLLGNYTEYYIANMFLIGIILSLLRIREANIITCIGFHSAWNFILILLSPLFNDNTERYIEFNLTTTFVLFAFLVYEIYLNAIKYKAR